MARMRIKDVAERAGVSPATVSRYLNNRPGTMTDETRARIAAVIEETGYRPNSAARSLRSERTHTLGVILADIRNPFSSAVLEELSRQAGERGYALVTSVTGNNPQVEATAVERLLDARVDGLLVNTCGGNDALLAETGEKVPVVLLDRDVAGAALDLVTSNNGELMAALVDELAGCGCRRVVLLGEHDESSSVRRERTARFAREAAERGLDGVSVALDYDADAAATQLEGLAGAGGGAGAPLGLIAINGLVFLRAVQALGASGLQVPEDARLATFDEYAWNGVLFGGVTTAAQDTPAMVAAVLERLLARIEGAAEKPQRVEVAGTVIRRASTAR